MIYHCHCGLEVLEWRDHRNVSAWETPKGHTGSMLCSHVLVFMTAFICSKLGPKPVPSFSILDAKKRGDFRYPTFNAGNRLGDEATHVLVANEWSHQ